MNTKTPSILVILRSLLWDVGLSLFAYLVAHWLGASDFVALLAGSVAALLRVVYVAAKARKFDVFAGVMCGVFGIGLLLSFMTGDARFMVAKESLATGAAGIAFLVSCFVGRPLIYHAALRMRAGKPEEIAEFQTKWDTLPQFRRVFVVCSAVWGCGLLAEALLRIPLVFILPTTVMVTLSSVLLIGTMVVLSVWNVRYIKGVMARAEQQKTA